MFCHVHEQKQKEIKFSRDATTENQKFEAKGNSFSSALVNADVLCCANLLMKSSYRKNIRALLAVSNFV
jgi:hypothetical protein